MFNLFLSRYKMKWEVLFFAGHIHFLSFSIEKEMFSRCSKRNLYNSFKKVCAKFGRQDLQAAQTYREAKEMANDFKTAKEAMLKKFKENKYGKWVSKPFEEEMFNWWLLG